MLRHVFLTASIVLAIGQTALADDTPDCTKTIAPISSGYGANGPYTAEIESIPNPGYAGGDVQVFLPKGPEGPRPVVFFAHGFGPGQWQTYSDLILHTVSKGDIVVFSTYAMLGVSIDDRYNSLWSGFQAAVGAFGERMDLTRVGFVGHSFGAGATPALARKGLIEQGWGKNGSFLFELAPWYAYQLSDAQIAELPPNLVDAIEVFDQDTVNDHRIAIDLFNAGHSQNRYYYMVQSYRSGACALVADHSTPGRNPSSLQRQYGIFRVFDALVDLVFAGNGAGHAALDGMANSAGGYQPLRRLEQPIPDQSENFYRWPWTNDRNPRR